MGNFYKKKDKWARTKHQVADKSTSAYTKTDVLPKDRTSTDGWNVEWRQSVNDPTAVLTREQRLKRGADFKQFLTRKQLIDRMHAAKLGTGPGEINPWASPRKILNSVLCPRPPTYKYPDDIDWQSAWFEMCDLDWHVSSNRE